MSDLILRGNRRHASYRSGCKSNFFFLLLLLLFSIATGFFELLYTTIYHRNNKILQNEWITAARSCRTNEQYIGLRAFLNESRVNSSVYRTPLIVYPYNSYSYIQKIFPVFIYRGIYVFLRFLMLIPTDKKEWRGRGWRIRNLGWKGHVKRGPPSTRWERKNHKLHRYITGTLSDGWPSSVASSDVASSH